MSHDKVMCAALVKAKRSFGPALKDKTNPAFRSKYADLGACIDAVEDALLENGLIFIQETFEDSTGVTVQTIFVHESGATLPCGKLHVPAAKQDPQGYGSALTYARRYSLMAACGIAPEDDDGNAATKAVKKPATDSLVPALEASIAKNERTLVMKVRTKIQEHITADRPMGVAEEWDFARSKGEEFQAGVWAGLTTPERDYVRETNNNRTMA